MPRNNNHILAMNNQISSQIFSSDVYLHFVYFLHGPLQRTEKIDKYKKNCTLVLKKHDIFQNMSNNYIHID